jgi:hypothetical protein
MTQGDIGCRRGVWRLAIGLGKLAEFERAKLDSAGR